MKNALIKGDEGTYTGKSEMKHGGEMFEVEMIEGHRKGQKSWTYKKSGESYSDFHNRTKR